MAFIVSSCVPRQTVLGEGVRWDAARQELLWVDIVEGILMRQGVGGDGRLEDLGELRLDRPLGAVAPVEGDGWLAAAGRGLARLERDGRLSPIAVLAPAGQRVNDAAADPAGRLFVGTMSETQEPGVGALHRLDRAGRAVQVLDGLTIPNGIGWSPDHSTMYLAESSPGLIWAFPFDARTGALGERRTLVDAAGGDGVPDGLTVDRNGDLWVAFHGAGAVRRYRPDGTLREVIHLPAPQATACAFGGPDLDILFVSTATEGYDERRRAAEPLSGTLLRVDGLDAAGEPARPFQPDGDWWRDLGSAPSPAAGNRAGVRSS